MWHISIVPSIYPSVCWYLTLLSLCSFILVLAKHYLSMTYLVECSAAILQEEGLQVWEAYPSRLPSGQALHGP